MPLHEPPHQCVWPSPCRTCIRVLSWKKGVHIQNEIAPWCTWQQQVSGAPGVRASHSALCGYHGGVGAITAQKPPPIIVSALFSSAPDMTTSVSRKYG